MGRPMILCCTLTIFEGKKNTLKKLIQLQSSKNRQFTENKIQLLILNIT